MNGSSDRTTWNSSEVRNIVGAMETWPRTVLYEIEPARRNCKHGVRSRSEVKRTWQHTMTVDDSEKVNDQIGQPAIQARSEAYLDNLAQMCITNHRVA